MNIEISPKLLQEYIKSKKDKRKNIYRHILDKCYKHIRFTVLRKREYFCTFNIPIIDYGIPIVDIKNCTYYLKKKLEKKGFYVEILGDNNIYISWK